MGYYKDEVATAAVVDADGFFHTGDLGRVDADGFLTITGRKKELIITAGGENIPPVLIEAAVLECGGGLSHAVVIGEGKKYLVCLLTLQVEVISAPCGPCVLW